ncbi:MAG: hypothetical protein K6E30_00830 [Lachnospiraceae bacterium]|nr:hypothetical protein [Lachnospiraceae bacterium]
MTDMMDLFAKYVKEQFGYDIILKASATPDTFKSLFGTGFLEQDDADIYSCEGMDNGISYSNTIARINLIDKYFCDGTQSLPFYRPASLYD